MSSDFFLKNKYLILLVLLGLILISLGFFFYQNGELPSNSRIEVLDASSEAEDPISEVVVEISGEVENPGVYKLPQNSRIDNLLIVSGGLSENADREWVSKNINRAAKLSDGQKLYVPGKNEGLAVGSRSAVSKSGALQTGFININTADLKTLDGLSGIGPVYAQNIIDQRPYSDVSELINKGVIPNNVYLKIKDNITCY